MEVVPKLALYPSLGLIYLLTDYILYQLNLIKSSISLTIYFAKMSQKEMGKEENKLRLRPLAEQFLNIIFYAGECSG